LELAQGYNKLVKKADGEEYMYSPFTKLIMPLMNESKDVDIKPRNSVAEEGKNCSIKVERAEVTESKTDILHNKPAIEDESKYY
jgi:hypothetical protein